MSPVPSQADRVRGALKRTATTSWQALIVLLGAAVLLYVIGQLWTAVLPVVLALLLSTLLWPLTRFLRNHRWPPALAAALVTLVFVVLILGVITLIVVPVVSQAGSVASGVSSGIQTVQDWVKGPPFNLGNDQVGNLIDKGLTALQSGAGDLASVVLGGVGALGDSVITAALTTVLVFFYLKDGPKFLPWVRKQTGEPAGGHVTELATRSYATISGFMRSQGLVGLLDSLLIGIGLLIVGVPLVLPLALLVFIGAFVPIIGAFVSGGFAVLIALVSVGWVKALIVLAIIVVVQQLEGNVFAPIIQSKSQNLHPATIILAVIVGSSLSGVIGALLAVPIAALVGVFWRYSQEQLAEQEEAAALEPAPVTAEDLPSAPD